MTRLIAVASAKGSPGCSFVAAGLARCLADGGVRTLLVDADAEDHGLAPLLGVGTPAGGDEHRLGDHLGLLELPFEADEVAARGLAGTLRQGVEAVVADLGHLARVPQQQLAVGSDWLLWVVTPDATGIERAARAIAAGRLVAASAGVVLNRAGRGAGLGALEAARLPVLARLPRDERAARGGRPPHRTRSFSRPLRELARSVHPRAPEVAPAWP